MKDSKIILQKGKSIKFLDYTIKNSSNNDGLVLMKLESNDYECHLGNYGEGTKENVDSCKRYAIMYFMLARPETFACTMVHKAMEINSGTSHEYFLFKDACKKENIELPEEITCGDDMNCMIYFNNKPLAREPEEPVCGENAIELLIEDYKGKLEDVSNIIATTKNNGSVGHIAKFARLSATQNEYRTFISALERSLTNQIVL